MRKINKQMLKLILLSISGGAIGAYFKINDNPNADYILACAIVFKFTGIIGLLFFNRKKIFEFLS